MELSGRLQAGWRVARVRWCSSEAGHVLKLCLCCAPNGAKMLIPSNSCVSFFPTPSTALTPAGCLAVQLNSDSIYLEKH